MLKSVEFPAEIKQLTNTTKWNGILTDSQQTASQCHDVLQTDITVQPSINNCTEEYYSSGT